MPGLREARRFVLTVPIEGITGAKYGYTRAAGFNGAAFVQRGDKKIVAVVFGARTTPSLVKKMGELVDHGFVSSN